MIRSLTSLFKPRSPSPPPPDEFTLLHRDEYSPHDNHITLNDVVTAFYTQFYRERDRSRSNAPSEQDIRYWPETEVKEIRGYYHQKYGRSFIRSTIVRPIQQSEAGGVVTVRSDLPIFKVLDGTACHGEKSTKFAVIECPEWFDGQVIVDDLNRDDLADISPTLPVSTLSGAEGLERHKRFRDPYRLFDSVFSQMLRQSSGISTGSGSNTANPFLGPVEGSEGDEGEEMYEMDPLLPGSVYGAVRSDSDGE